MSRADFVLPPYTRKKPMVSGYYWMRDFSDGDPDESVLYVGVIRHPASGMTTRYYGDGEDMGEDEPWEFSGPIPRPPRRGPLSALEGLLVGVANAFGISRSPAPNDPKSLPEEIHE